MGKIATLLSMKVKPALSRMIIMAVIIALICGVAIFLVCLDLFIFQKWSYVQWLIIGVFIVSSIVIFFLSRANLAYVIDSKGILVLKFKKKIYYQFDSILWLDESKGEKNNTTTFVMNKGHVIYLIPDKEREVYKAIKKHSKNLLTIEEVKAKFPGIKL